jgi:uncharacterized membrane protein
MGVVVDGRDHARSYEQPIGSFEGHLSRPGPTTAAGPPGALAFAAVARTVLNTFRNRGEDISRLEGFSDTAFGFAITLLVVSLAAPTRFAELLQLMRGLPAFAVTFFLVATIWYSQYTFFRRYGLGDFATVVLNLVLLFVVLFYVYPLKFLFGLVFQPRADAIRDQDVPTLFLIYGVGFAAVSLVLALLYVHAFRHRAQLQLTPWEEFVTRLSVADNLAMMCIGLLSAGLAQVVPAPYTATVAGFAYFSIALPKTIFGTMRGRRARSLVTV